MSSEKKIPRWAQRVLDLHDLGPDDSVTWEPEYNETRDRVECVVRYSHPREGGYDTYVLDAFYVTKDKALYEVQKWLAERLVLHRKAVENKEYLH